MDDEKDKYQQWRDYLGAVENSIERGKYDAAGIRTQFITAMALVEIARLLEQLVISVNNHP